MNSIHSLRHRAKNFGSEPSAESMRLITESSGARARILSHRNRINRRVVIVEHVEQVEQLEHQVHRPASCSQGDERKDRGARFAAILVTDELTRSAVRSTGQLIATRRRFRISFGGEITTRQTTFESARPVTRCAVSGWFIATENSVEGPTTVAPPTATD